MAVLPSKLEELIQHALAAVQADERHHLPPKFRLQIYGAMVAHGGDPYGLSPRLKPEGRGRVGASRQHPENGD